VDGGGNVFVSDLYLGPGYPSASFNSHLFKEIPASCITGANNASCVLSLEGSFQGTPVSGQGVAVDGEGNLYVAQNGIYELAYAHPPTVSFLATLPDQTGSGTPKTAIVFNDGNANLDFSALSYPPDFPEATGVTTNCSASSIVASATSCTVSIDFIPLESSLTPPATTLNELIPLTTNSLNKTTAQPMSATGTVTAAPPAALTSPETGSVLVNGSAVTFQWTAASGATGYALRLSTLNPGGNEVFGSSVITATSLTISHLKASASTVYARLYTLYGSIQVYKDYFFTGGTQVTLTSPTTSPLVGPTVTFTWGTASGATGYAVRLGTSAGASDIYGSGIITANSRTISNLPTNGEKIYVRLFTIYGENQLYIDYNFQAATQSALTSPSTGSALTGPTAVFSWTTAAGATGYAFRLGTSLGANDVYGSGIITATSITVPNLPINGEPVFGRLYTMYGSIQRYTDYAFTAATQAALTSPMPGSVLSGSSVNFIWTAGKGSSSYILQLGTTPGAEDLYSSGDITATSIKVSGLPTNGETIYARLYTNFTYSQSGTTQLYTDYVYTAAQ